MRHRHGLIAAAALLASATPALAARFSPPGTSVKITGKLYLQKDQSSLGIGCNVTFRGQVTSNGKLKIKGVSFCNRVIPYGLPWIWIAVQAHPPAGVAHMAFSLRNGFDCGFIDDGIFIVKKESAINFSEIPTSNQCRIVHGQATMTPAITIVH